MNKLNRAMLSPVSMWRGGGEGSQSGRGGCRAGGDTQTLSAAIKFF